MLILVDILIVLLEKYCVLYRLLSMSLRRFLDRIGTKMGGFRQT